MKRTLVLTLIVLVTLIGFGFHVITQVQAADCKKVEGASKEELQAIIDACSAKVSELSKQRTTLAEQIEYMDSQIYLTELRIQENEVLKARLQKEIENLGTRIGELDTTLTKVSISATAKIEEMYKRERGNRMLKLLASSSNLPTLIRTAGYLKKTQENDRNLLIKLQDTKVNFGEQKSLREVKEEELNALNQQLEAYQVDLGSQQAEKELLLQATKNDEATYQQLLEKARAELAGYGAFVQSAGGGGLTSFGSGSNGWYYTQRDPTWGNMLLPGSSSSLALAGCAITSVAMVCNSYGQGTTPSSLASDSSRFIYGDLWNWAFSCSGKNSTWLSYPSQEQVKSYTSSNTPVILRLIAPSVSGLHFIVAYAWDDGQSDFKIHDPYYGPDKYFSDQYSWGQVTTAIAIN